MTDLDRSKRSNDAAGDWLLHPRQSHGPMGWDRMIPNVRCAVVEGNHFTIMRQPLATNNLRLRFWRGLAGRPRKSVN